MPRLTLVASFLMVCLVSARGQDADDKKETVAYLQKLQAGDGGFLASAPKPNDKSSLRATSSAIRALKHFGGEPKDKNACARYVQSTFDDKDGAFVDVPGGKADVFSTAAGLMAVVELKLPVDKYADPAVKYLGKHAKTFDEIRIAAAALEAVGKRPAQAEDWLEEVLKMRNFDGTYGLRDAMGRDTGGAVVAVLRLGGKVEGMERANVVHAMQASQREDGAFGKGGVKGSDLESTYRVMRAFHMLKANPDNKAIHKFVARCRNDDGGYGVEPGQPSGVSGTYYAGTILDWLDEK
jgi:prenyltransferase beta subunit